MPDFIAGGSTSTPFGRNEYLRSVRGKKTESYMFAKSALPALTIDGIAGQKILQMGVVLAKITSGADSGKVGPFQGGSASVAATNEVQKIDLGSASAGSVAITFDGETVSGIAYNATATAVRTALNTMSNVSTGDIAVTGGPFPAQLTLTFGGQYAATDVPEITAAATGLTGGAVTISTTTEGAAASQGSAASDGRGDLANIVGLCDTFLPWQLMERDVEVAAVYECAAVQAWCLEYTSDAAGSTPGVLSNRTASAMQRGGAAGKGIDISWK